ncbi:MAG: hypothetical protein CL928_13010 [Deltaproteobacteria bacterium]|nr:hypothetical protein [Deltaproteobacteria bacterium]
MKSTNPLANLRKDSRRPRGPSQNLLFVLGGRESFRIPTPAHSLRIGRGHDCEIRLPDPSCELSRIHLVVERRPGSMAIRDCSTNGSRVNGQALSGTLRRLVPGDRVTAGPWEIRVESSTEATTSDEAMESPTVPMDRSTLVEVDGVSDSRQSRGLCEQPIVGRSSAIRRCLARAARLAQFDMPVVVHGETGTGKELIARSLHDLSHRATQPYVALNCGAIHRETAASTLFGHEAGAFTGARRRRTGLFEEAGAGTIFLDEIGELSPDLQASLLRVLETGELRPMGSTKTIPARCRLVAATHKDLAHEAKQGRFRSDLYYRIHVANLRVPSLRDRGDDILLLANYFLRRHSPGPPPSLSSLSQDLLRQHRWPGNVRELRNVVLRALIQCEEETVRPEHLEFDPDTLRVVGLSVNTRHSVPPARPTDATLRAELVESLRLCQGNRSRAARDLGISRSTLYARMERLGLACEGDPGIPHSPPADPDSR